MSNESSSRIVGLLETLLQSEVEFILVGGVAAIVHGSARLTFDIDLVYRRSHENNQRLVTALKDLQPYLRGAPAGLPFRWDLETIERGLNFTLSTSLGPLDLLAEIPGGNYKVLLPHSEEIEIYGLNCYCLSLEKLIEVKRAAGRPKDLETIAELEALLEERDNSYEE